MIISRPGQILIVINLLQNQNLSLNIKCNVIQPRVTARDSKRNYARRDKTALGLLEQTETYLKAEDLRFNKTIGNFHKCFISCAVECPDNIYFIQNSDKHNQLMLQGFSC